MVFQRPVVLRRSALDNVVYPLKVAGLSRTQCQRQAFTALERVGLARLADRPARVLSSGEQQRLALARAWALEPEVLFLDEPTLGLDVLARRNILRFVRDVNRERQVTVVVTSHDMDELEQLAGRIVMLHRGNIAFDGDFASLRREVSDRRVLLLETTPGGAAPALVGAERTGGENGRHEYAYDARQVRLSDLLEQAAAQTQILDVETHRAPIDGLVADLYERWQRERS
jgi:ABC-2 type transport system ATP-binding protein